MDLVEEDTDPDKSFVLILSERFQPFQVQMEMALNYFYQLTCLSGTCIIMQLGLNLFTRELSKASSFLLKIYTVF